MKPLKLEDVFLGFVDTVKRLRDPKNGCPWDLKQTHLTLRPFMVEEAYEAVEAMTSGHVDEIRDELGDVLLQVVLNAQVAQDQGNFNIADVIRGIDAKMRRRHPHVFDNADGKAVSVDQVKDNWEKIKSAEKKGQAPDKKGLFGKVKEFPATQKALKIGKIANKIDFDWDGPSQVLSQLKAEIQELEHEMLQGPSTADRIEDELGDVYFTLAQLSRHLGIDPEVVANRGNSKFLRRFQTMEQLLRSENREFKDLSRKQKEALWGEAKKKEFT